MALRRRNKAPTDSDSQLMNEPDRTTEGKFLKACGACGAIALCFVLYCRLWTTGEYFRPEAVAEMGLPSWMVFVFTVLVAAYAGLSVSHLYLTVMLLCTWTTVPRTPPLDVKSCA